MPLVKPDFGTAEKTEVFQKPQWTPGRYAAKVIEIKESDKTDRHGYNALVFKFEVFKSPTPTLIGKRLSRWYPLGGMGAKSLWRCLKTLNPEYNGRDFNTDDYIGRKLEIEVDVAPDKDGNVWPKINKVFPFIEPQSVASNLKGNVMDVVGLVDDFDA